MMYGTLCAGRAGNAYWLGESSFFIVDMYSGKKSSCSPSLSLALFLRYHHRFTGLDDRGLQGTLQ